MAVTCHWIDENWLMRATVLEFKLFTTPYAGDVACQFIYEVIKARELNVLKWLLIPTMQVT